jgi:nucleoside-diphosphate-sugar epimerase
MLRDGRKKAIVAGASGVVGRRLAEYLNGQDDWEVIGLSRGEPIGGNDVPRIAVDLSDRTDTTAKLGHLGDVTHIFYEARFDHAEGQPEPIQINLSMFRNLIGTVEPIATNLQHVHVGSGHKNYGLHSGPAPTPARE